MGNQTTKQRHIGMGQRARRRRLAAGISLQQAATRGATTPQTWIQLERYDLATTQTINKVARVLGVNVDELTGRIGGDNEGQ